MFKKMFTDDEILNFIHSRAFIKNCGGIIILYQFSDNVLVEYDQPQLSIIEGKKMRNHYQWIERNIICKDFGLVKIFLNCEVHIEKWLKT